MNDFDIMNFMAKHNKDIMVIPGENIKRAQTGKDGWGEITIAIPNIKIINLNDYSAGLYLVNSKEFEATKKILESEGCDGKIV